MEMTTRCPECNEAVKGLWWDGGHIIVYEHKGLVDGKQHHYKLSVETDQLDGVHGEKENAH